MWVFVDPFFQNGKSKLLSLLTNDGYSTVRREGERERVRGSIEVERNVRGAMYGNGWRACRMERKLATVCFI